MAHSINAATPTNQTGKKNGPIIANPKNVNMVNEIMLPIVLPTLLDGLAGCSLGLTVGFVTYNPVLLANLQ